ncbi:MAG: hypothetical protein A2169_15420 [Deltaproteobacteria bacterium RBG_13_47_9]|nr:MAG: hypothetical protein A2169_15420 [Deltaproteobacteria bacterium RBG_13_47_9]
MADHLSPLERIKYTIEGKEVDRLPVLAVTKMFGIKKANIPLTDCIKGDPDLYVSSQWSLVKDLNHEALWGYSGLFPINEVLDPSTVRVTPDDLFVERRYLESIKDVMSLPQVKIEDQGRIPWLLEIIRKLKEVSENRYPIFGWVSLPFEAAWMLRGHDIYTDLLEAPELVHRLLEYCLNLHLEYAVKMKEAGADIIWTTNPVVNAECISRNHFETFSFRLDKTFFSTLHELGIRTMAHVCGDWSDRVDKVFELGADIYYLSKKFDLSESKKRCGTKCVIMGNVPAVEILLQGTPEDVKREALKCIEIASSGGRFILGPDCTVPRDTPWENIGMLFQVAKEACK